MSLEGPRGRGRHEEEGTFWGARGEVKRERLAGKPRRCRGCPGCRRRPGGWKTRVRGRGTWERGREGAGAVSACLGGSPDFGEADAGFGLSGFWVRVLEFLGAGGPPDERQLGLERGCPCVPESRKGLGISAAEISCEPRGRRQV